MNALRLFLQQRLGISLGSAEEEKPPIVLEGFKKFTLEEVAKFIQSDKCKHSLKFCIHFSFLADGWSFVFQ